VTVLRTICIAGAVGAAAAVLVVGQPEVYSFLLLSGGILFVVGAGSIAADAFPLRSRLALACSALTPVAALFMATAGLAGLPPYLAVAPVLAVTLAPVVAPRMRRRPSA
jgi:hypothetical protein